jgi:hypothetical protein
LNIGIREEHRSLGTYICGNPGSGKSSLLQHLILWDIRKDHGVCVIDPTHQLIKGVIDYLPASRKNDVVYFNTSMNIPLDFFSGQDDDERQELITDITNIIDLSTAPIAKHYLRRVITALLEANNNPKVYKPGHHDHRYTLLDILPFIQNEDRRNEVLLCCPPERAYDFPPHIKLQQDSINAVVIRMSQITDSPTMKRLLGARSAALNVADLIEGNKIFLVDLKETEDDQIIGSIIAAKIQHAIFRRRHLTDLYSCKPYYLYIDECDVILKFAESRFAAILGRARKYKLGMTIANPIPSDLPDTIQKGLGKIGNLVLFNLDEADGRIFKAKLLPYTPLHLVNLAPFTAFFRTANTVRAIKTPPFLPALHNNHAEYIEDSTIRLFGPEACKPEQVSHTSGDGDTGTPKTEATEDPPPKERGRPPIPPDGTQQSHNQRPREQFRRKNH